MQQWFEEEHINSDSSLRHPIVEKIPKLKKKTEMMVLKTFIVEAETRPGQQVCVVGNCQSLGNWEINDAFVLTNTNLTITKNE